MISTTDQQRRKWIDAAACCVPLTTKSIQVTLFYSIDKVGWTIKICPGRRLFLPPNLNSDQKLRSMSNRSSIAFKLNWPICKCKFRSPWLKHDTAKGNNTISMTLDGTVWLIFQKSSDSICKFFFSSFDILKYPEIARKQNLRQYFTLDFARFIQTKLKTPSPSSVFL